MGQLWRNAAVQICTAFVLGLVAIAAPAPSAQADDIAPPGAKRSDAASRPQEWLKEHLARGFVELRGKEAMAFLSGNSILRTDANAPWKVSYFPDARSMYVCDSLDTTYCTVRDISRGENDVRVSLCENDTDVGLDVDCVVHPALLMAPKGYGDVNPSNGFPWWAGEIGIFVRGDGKLDPVLAGRWIDIPDYSLGAKPELLTAPASDLKPFVSKGDTWRPGQSNEIVITPPVAKAFLIGNTALTPEDARSANRDDVVCPGVATYYAPHGLQIRLSCSELRPAGFSSAVVERITRIETLRWKLIAGHFCWTSVDGARDDYVCDAANLAVSPIDEKKPDEMYKLETWDGQIYKGNVLNVR